jgi:hypothetical protein
MLQENASLENISIQNYNKIKTKAEEYFVLVIALQHKTTLKTLSTTCPDGSLNLTHDEDNQLAVLLQKNYALESLPFINDQGEVPAPFCD